MPEPLTPSQNQEIEDHLENLDDKKKDSKIGNVKGFYGYLEGMEKPPKTKKGGKAYNELRELLEKIKTIKPFFRDKDPKLSPLVNYFYCRYMAAWITNQGFVESSFDMKSPVTVGPKMSPADRFEMFCELIESTYTGKTEDGEPDPNVATIERLFPFDRVKTVGDKIGMLQRQYGLLRTKEREKFRSATKNFKVPVRRNKNQKKNIAIAYGQTVAYYRREYLKDENRLSYNERRLPQIISQQGDIVFMEIGAIINGMGIDILNAEKEGYERIKDYALPDNPSDEDIDAFESEEYALMYLPTAAEEGFSHYMLDPYGDGISIYLKDEDVFATKENDYTTPFRWVSGGDSYIPPNPKDNKSFAALGDYVESLMAHLATASLEIGDAPGNNYEEVHKGLLGVKNVPGIAVYHANVFYHLLLAQARDPISNWREVDSEIFSQGRLIGLEAYFGQPLQSLCLYLLRNRNYVDFEGIDPNTNSPRIKSPTRLSVSQAVVDEEAKAEMANSLSKLMIAYYRCMYSMLKSRPFLFPKMRDSLEGKDYDLKQKGKQDGMDVRNTDWINLDTLWDGLLKDVKKASIDPMIMAKIADFMYAKGEGQLLFPATLDSTSAVNKDGWNNASIEKWLKFSYSARPTSIDMYVECAAAVYAAINMTDYNEAKTHQSGINRFVVTVGSQNGWPFLIALLSNPISDALDSVRLEERPGMSYLPPETRSNPDRTAKEPQPEEEYYVNIEIDLPIEIDLQNEMGVLARLDKIEDMFSEHGIDEAANIGTDGKKVDMSWYIKGLDEASELLLKVTEIYSELGVPGRGWLEWGREELNRKHTVDGYSLEDL